MTPQRYQKIVSVLAARQPDLTVVLDRVHKPHNVAAVIRTCDAVGIGRIHAVSGERELARHAAISKGSRKWVQVRMHSEIEGAMRHLRDQGMQLVAAHAGDDCTDFRSIDYTRPTALLLGAELWGVSEQGLAAADVRIRIPMAGMVASLNVSVAAAVVLYEAQRQRVAAGRYRPRMTTELQRDAFEWAYPRIARRCREKGLEYPELTEEGLLPRGWRLPG